MLKSTLCVGVLAVATVYADHHLSSNDPKSVGPYSENFEVAEEDVQEDEFLVERLGGKRKFPIRSTGPYNPNPPVSYYELEDDVEEGEFEMEEEAEDEAFELEDYHRRIPDIFRPTPTFPTRPVFAYEMEMEMEDRPRVFGRKRDLFGPIRPTPTRPPTPTGFDAYELEAEDAAVEKKRVRGMRRRKCKDAEGNIVKCPRRKCKDAEGNVVKCPRRPRKCKKNADGVVKCKRRYRNRKCKNAEGKLVKCTRRKCKDAEGKRVKCARKECEDAEGNVVKCPRRHRRKCKDAEGKRVKCPRRQCKDAEGNIVKCKRRTMTPERLAKRMLKRAAKKNAIRKHILPQLE